MFTGTIGTSCQYHPASGLYDINVSALIDNPCGQAQNQAANFYLQGSIDGSSFDFIARTSIQNYTFQPGQNNISESFLNQSIPAQYQYYLVRMQIYACGIYSIYAPVTPVCRPGATATPGGTPTPTPTPTPSATPCASVGSWTELVPYPIVISGHAVASQGGNVYSFGGIANNIAIANAYKYTPASNTWTPIASLPAPRGWFSAASDGTYIYLLGGVDQNFATTATLWRYDPASNTYNTSLPPYTIPTYFHASVYLNGKIYRIAGRAIGTDCHVEVYDIATNTWSMAANYPFANHSLMAVALGGYIYAAGGNASPDKTYRYDPSTNTWDDAAIADLPAGRSAAASGAYNGRWLLAGGDVNFATSNSVIAWDPATNTWDNLPNMVQARDYLEGATAGQSFYAVAGNSGPGTPTDDNQQYTETPCATRSPTPTATATATPTPTATATTTATATATPTVAPTPTATPTPPPTVSISGTVTYCSNPALPPVPNVTMTLTGTSSGSTLTDGSGNYTFSSLPSGGNYTVTPAKAALAPGSADINTVDVIAIQRHFLNLGTPLSGCKLTAADVNGVGGVNTIDVIAVQRFFLGQVTGTADTGKYQFTPVNRSYTGIVTNQIGQNYDALVFGDVATGFVHRPEGPEGPSQPVAGDEISSEVTLSARRAGGN